MRSQETKIPPTSVKKVGEIKISGRLLPVWCSRKVIYFGATAMEPEEAREAANLLMQAVSLSLEAGGTRHGN